MPTELGLLTDNLEVLDLSFNSLSGTLPSELGRLSHRLRHLDLAGNAISGSMPSELGQLTRLRHLSLHSNLISGELPFTLGALSPAFCYLTANTMMSTADAQFSIHPMGSSPALVAADGSKQANLDNRFLCRPPALPAAPQRGI